MQEDLSGLLKLVFASLFSKWVDKHVPPAVQQEIWFYTWRILLSLLLLWILHAVVSELLSWAARKSTRVNLNAKVEDLRRTIRSFRIESTKAYRWPLLISMLGLACAAIGTWPYDFYTLLRFAILLTCLSLILGAGLALHHRSWAWSLAGIALLYNPFLPARLHRETWAAINWATFVIFGLLLALMTTAQSQVEPKAPEPKALEVFPVRGADGRFLPKPQKDGTTSSSRRRNGNKANRNPKNKNRDASRSARPIP